MAEPFSNALSLVSGSANPLAPPVQLAGSAAGVTGTFLTLDSEKAAALFPHLAAS